MRADGGRKHIPIILFFYVRANVLRAFAKRAVTAQASGVRGHYHPLSRRWTFPSPKTQPVIELWQNWGPEATRWIEPEGQLLLSVRQSLSGTRCAISKVADEEVQLLDFNPGRVHDLGNWAKRKGRESLRKHLVESESTISAGKYFKHDIVSRLPYFEVRRRAKGQLLIDDQWAVQTHVCLFQFYRVAHRLIYFQYISEQLRLVAIDFRLGVRSQWPYYLDAFCCWKRVDRKNLGKKKVAYHAFLYLHLLLYVSG